ncbi:MAG: hypothetical protein AAGC60_29415 [Acidobacteriota bacterium]
MRSPLERLLLLLPCVLLCLGSASGDIFSRSQLPAGGVGQPIAGGSVCGPIVLSQSSSTAVEALNSVACTGGGLHTDNSYFRAFDGSDVGGLAWFEVCSISLGIESATGAGGDQPVEIILWAGPDGFPTGFPGSYTQIASTSVQIPDQALTVIEIPITPVVPGDVDLLVVEVFTPNGQTEGNRFFIGSNNAGESGPSYIQAADCSAPTPTPTSVIGIPQMQIVLEVNGDLVIPDDPPPLVPVLQPTGLLILTVLLVLAGSLLIHRRS